MAIRIEWDEFEIALLIEACEEVLRKGKPKSEVVKTVSSNLRKRAISKNIAIDDVFRNENGIALQMQKMAYLLTHGEKGMPGASKLYAEVAELREENPKKFEEILKRAKEEIEMTDLSQQNIDKKALFAQWLNEHPIKKYTPSAIIDALDVASRYCVSKKVCKDGFWSMQNKAEFNAATSKLLSFRLFRLKYRSAAAKMDKAIPLYKAFLDSYVASREENTAEFEGEALNEPDSMLSTAAANSDDIIRLDFSDIGSLIFSKPVCLNYKDHTFTDFNSWASLYAKVAFLLKQDYPQIIVDGGSLSEGAAPEFSMNSKALRKPKAITDGLFIETNHSATEIASRIATLLRLCGVDLNKVSITYTLKKEAEQKRTSQARSENEKMNEYEYMLGELPTLFQETALLDRIHGFVKGWDIPRMNDSLKVTGWALNSEYFCSILHELRNDMSYSAIVEKLVKGPDDADTRDAKAIKKIATAYLKLLFPNVQSEIDVDKTEFRDYCLIPAMKMRRIIKLQQGFIDTEYKGKDVPFFTVDD